MRAPGLLVLALTLVVVAGACTSQQTKVQSSAQPRRSCSGSEVAAERALQRRRLDADLLRLRAAAATVNGQTQNGNAVLDKALDRFELDVAMKALPARTRSRYIDRAAAIVAPRCYLCFQTLEANRPFAAGAKVPCD